MNYSTLLILITCVVTNSLYIVGCVVDDSEEKENPPSSDSSSSSDTGDDSSTDSSTDSDTSGDIVSDKCKFLWHTFYGDGNGDYSSSIVLDEDGSMLIAGYSFGNWEGPNGESPLHAHSGQRRDVFVLKLDENGLYKWHTFFGGDTEDRSSHIAVDGRGNIFVSGQSESIWYGPDGESPLNEPTELNGSHFVLKLDSEGGYNWHTFYGSYATEFKFPISLDKTGNVIASGSSDGYPWNGPNGEKPLNEHSDCGLDHTFVLKLDSNGNYLWHTFYGSLDACFHNSSVAVNGAGDILVLGSTSGDWFGPNGETPLNEHSGKQGHDYAILKLNSNGVYQWHTYLNGVEVAEFGSSITVDEADNILVSGISAENWYGPDGQSPLSEHSGEGSEGYPWDILVFKLNSEGEYMWHTFLGGAEGDYSLSISVDSEGNVFVTGYSYKNWRGPNGQAPVIAHSGQENQTDVVVLKLDSFGAYKCHMFLGGVQDDWSRSAAVGTSGTIYVLGQSDDIWYGSDGENPLNPYSAASDIFIAQVGVSRH